MGLSITAPNAPASIACATKSCPSSRSPRTAKKRSPFWTSRESIAARSNLGSVGPRLATRTPFSPSQTAVTLMLPITALPLAGDQRRLCRRNLQIWKCALNDVLERGRGDHCAPRRPLRLVDLHEDSQDGVVQRRDA